MCGPTRKKYNRKHNKPENINMNWSHWFIFGNKFLQWTSTQLLMLKFCFLFNTLKQRKNVRDIELIDFMVTISSK